MKVRLKPLSNLKKTRKLVYNPTILSKGIHLLQPKKSSLYVYREFWLCSQIYFKEGYERFLRKKTDYEGFSLAIVAVFHTNFPKKMSLKGLTWKDSLIGFVISNPTDHVGNFVLIRVLKQILVNKSFCGPF